MHYSCGNQNKTIDGEKPIERKIEKTPQKNPNQKRPCGDLPQHKSSLKCIDIWEMPLTVVKSTKKNGFCSEEFQSV